MTKKQKRHKKHEKHSDMADAPAKLVVTMRKSKFGLNCLTLLRYFMNMFKEKTGQKYPFDSEDYQPVCNMLKRKVIDHLVLNAMDENDIIVFVNWVFENKSPEDWFHGKLPGYFQEWMRHRITNAPKSEDGNTIDRSEETQFLTYLGEGYFDNELTRLQYWTGLVWRWKNLSPTDLEKIKERQKKSYKEDTLLRLREWEQELRGTPDFNAIRQFYLELAASRGEKVGETLKTFARESYARLFTEHELEITPQHAPLDKT